MNYKNYLTKATTPTRLTRKQSRRNIFVTNKRMAKLARRPRTRTQAER